jgi:hypothetical protein
MLFYSTGTDQGQAICVLHLVLIEINLNSCKSKLHINQIFPIYSINFLAYTLPIWSFLFKLFALKLGHFPTNLFIFPSITALIINFLR